MTENRFQNKTFEVNAKTPITLRLNTYYFPGWKAKVDGNEMKIDDINKYKLITISLPKESKKLELRFENTEVRKIGEWVTVISVWSIIILFIFIRISRKENKHD